MARHPAVGYTGAANAALAGIVCAVAASFLFVLQDAGVKWLTAELVVLQILFLRSAVEDPGLADDLFQNGGRTTTVSDAPSSFQTPSPLEARTRKT